MDIYPDGTARLQATREMELSIDLRLQLIDARGDKTNGYAEFQVRERVLDLHPYITNEYHEGGHILFIVRDGALYPKEGLDGTFCSDEAPRTLEDPICGV